MNNNDLLAINGMFRVLLFVFRIRYSRAFAHFYVLVVKTFWSLCVYGWMTTSYNSAESMHTAVIRLNWQRAKKKTKQKTRVDRNGKIRNWWSLPKICRRFSFWGPAPSHAVDSCDRKSISKIKYEYLKCHSISKNAIIKWYISSTGQHSTFQIVWRKGTVTKSLSI